LFVHSSSDSGRLFVEIFLNYDCDVEVIAARENIWERFINSLCRLASQHHSSETLFSSSGGSISHPVSSKTSETSSLASQSINLPPAITTANMSNFTREQVKEIYSATGDYAELKKRSLEVIVRGILKQLVAWCCDRAEADALNWWIGGKIASSSTTSPFHNEGAVESDTSEPGLLREDDASRSGVDIPSQFESQLHWKQQLMEGIASFNSKPKKVSIGEKRRI
jgi:brefeldin A-inhibited guanine nucleotide-exchange protein